MGDDVTDVRTESVRIGGSWREELVAQCEEAQARLHRLLADEDDAEEWL